MKFQKSIRLQVKVDSSWETHIKYIHTHKKNRLFIMKVTATVNIAE